MDEPKDVNRRIWRSAGLLLHISSLPSPFGIGDLGPEAYRFADFLYRSHQSYWQLLPLNPTTSSQSHSPYSAYSSMAGNPLLISPEMLLQEGLLNQPALDAARSAPSEKLDYDAALRTKSALLDAAYQQFITMRPHQLTTEFEEFCERERYWLDDFALYTVLRSHHEHKPWYQWPEDYRNRTQPSLRLFEKDHHQEIEQCKWQQMIFDKQWHDLRKYCHAHDIQLFGDLPFYVGQDSADVWAHREIFAITPAGELSGVAGVPPDAFSETGQRWGMPVFKWEVLKTRKYDWWVTRLKKNMQFFDLLRLDHFRAFASYWEVPPDEETAVNGQWEKGPGSDFFHTVQTELGSLPFIAEDLGKIDAAVLKLRDELELPGMNVLHFAFADNMPYAPYIPHHHNNNSVTYTGTHDNNTTKGWFNKLTPQEAENISIYLAQPVTENNICKLMNRLAYSSVSDLTILPLQDVLELDEDARMNAPASSGQNWAWRLDKSLLTKQKEKDLQEWCRIFDRSPRLHEEYLCNNPEED